MPPELPLSDAATPLALSPRRPIGAIRLSPSQRIALLVALLAACTVFSLGIGRYPLDMGTVARILFAMATGTGDADSGPWTPTQWVVIDVVRLPRVVLVTLSGMGLALCGAVLQGLFRNPLVGPEVAGVTAGASFGGVAAILYSLPIMAVVGCAFVGGVAALAIAYGVARLAGGASVLSLVLAGVIVGAFFHSLVGMAQYVADPEIKLPSIVFWLLGSFVGADWRKVLIMAVAFGGAGTLLLGLRWRLNLLSLGELDARTLGVRVELLRWLLVALVAVVVAAQVSVSGGVGWVGLVIPHFARMLVGPDHRILLPTSALMGGLYLLLMDDAARTLTAQEIPIGLLTAMVGTPIFAYVFWKSRAGGWSRE